MIAFGRRCKLGHQDCELLFVGRTYADHCLLTQCKPLECKYKYEVPVKNYLCGSVLRRITERVIVGTSDHASFSAAQPQQHHGWVGVFGQLESGR